MTFHCSRIDFFGLGPINTSSLTDSLRPFGWPVRTDQKAVFDYVKIASIAFWDAYLKDQPKAKAYLKSDSLIAYSRNSLAIDRK